MVNYLDSLYTNIGGNNRLFLKFRIYSILRILVRFLANFIIPILYSFNKTKYSLSRNSAISKRYIVSLTSFPKRINKLWIVVESILRQTHKPDKIVLWLSKDQFSSYDDLPYSLLEQQNRGLEIHFVDDDIKSHKKYFYSLKLFPNDYLITVDDDIIYPNNLVEQLVLLNQDYPNSICCHRAHKIMINRENNNLLSYSLWNELTSFHGPSSDIFFTTGGGTLFPPNSLDTQVYNSDVFKSICLNADDIWLNIMAKIRSTSIVKSCYYSSLLPVINYNDVSLFDLNSGANLNDVQLNNVRQYFLKYFKVDPFLDCN